MNERFALAGALVAAVASAVIAIPAIEPTPRPLVGVIPLFRDFGVVEPNAVLSSEFTFSNLSSKPLFILNIATDCGCTVALPTATELPPGGKTVVTATIRAGEHAASFEQHFMIEYRFSGEEGSHSVMIPLRLQVQDPMISISQTEEDAP